jgi:hypothetical protein
VRRNGRGPVYWTVCTRGRSNADGMRVTLEKMKAVVESGQ